MPIHIGVSDEKISGLETMSFYEFRHYITVMGVICPIYKDRCPGKDCKFWRADARIDKKADTVYELDTGECIIIKLANHLLSK